MQISPLLVIPVLFRNQKIGITITTTAVYTIALITFPPAGSFLFSIIFGLGSQGGSGSLTGRPGHIQYVEGQPLQAAPTSTIWSAFINGAAVSIVRKPDDMLVVGVWNTLKLGRDDLRIERTQSI
jgi:hypothetical protein